jgi:hypothetical protein
MKRRFSNPRWLSAAMVAMLWLVVGIACNNNNRVVVPNRVLDRPTDLALGCVRLGDDGRVQALSLNLCEASSAPSCSETDRPQLIGFVANSEKNEVAMWRRCDRRAGIVDLDIEASGYQLLPVGQVPSTIVTTGLSCRAVTANFGSCDMSVIDARQLGSYALGVTPEVAPSELVSTLVPRTADGQPLGSRPQAMLAVPDRLSQAAPLGDDAGDGGMVGGTDGDGGGTGIDDPSAGGTDEPPPDPGDGELVGEFSLCPVDKPESVYVTFPACQLVAEISLNSQRIIQSRRFVKQDDGTVVVEDAGSSPECPVECPAQFDGSVPDRATTIDPDGYYPSTLELVQPLAEDQQDEEFGDSEITYSALYVGGTGSDEIFEIRFDADGSMETGLWLPPEEMRSLRLADAKGVHAIRATPATLRSGGFADVHQFLYVVAGDGSTRVVDRDFDLARLGVECDTQRDPTLVSADDACVPIDPGVAPDSPDRRPFAVGPGIRAPNGATINDWTFQRVNCRQALARSGIDSMEATCPEYLPDAVAPFTHPGVVGIGVTSEGTVVFSTIEQFIGAESVSPGIDPVGIFGVSINPHSLWPSLDPTVLSPDPLSLPRMEDAEPERALPAAEDIPQALAPSLRLIDLAYAAGPGTDEQQAVGDVGVSFDQQFISGNLGFPANVDQLGSFTGETGLYENRVARVAVRDYQTWTAQAWNLLWEGTIPGTPSTTGRIECLSPGWEGGTCAVRGGPQDPDAPPPIQLVDEGATFCDNGVLPGDKLAIIGCSDDQDCGLGQRCLTEPTAPAYAGGICVSAQAFENDFELLRAACAPFIDDPCGQPNREYLISDAYQNRLELQMMNIPKTSHVRWGEVLDANGNPETDGDGNPIYSITEDEDRYTCRLPWAPTVDVRCDSTDGCPNGFACGDGDEYCQWQGNPVACTQDDDCQENWICSNDGVCRGPCGDGEPGCRECQEDTDCYENFGPEAICSDSLCRRPCEPGDPDCLIMPLPGPRCFAELVEYAVRARNAYIVTGEPSPGFLSDRVFTDPETGACREDPNVSSLLTSRIRLGENAETTFSDPVYGIPDCPNPDEAAPTDPNPCRIAQARETDPGSLFHYFSYGEGNPIEAIRFSNPYASFVLDLVSLRDLASELSFLPEPGYSWPETFAQFRRSRIPRNYRETVTTIDGFAPYQPPVVVGTVPMIYPVRIIDAPENGFAFIVDAGGRGGVAGVRGQILRINAGGVSQGAIGDETFRVQ